MDPVEPLRKAAVFALSNAPDPALLARGCTAMAAALQIEVLDGCPHGSRSYRRLAADDETRARCFQELVRDESADLLVAARGGYGVTRVLDRIDFEELRRSGKTVCGYSDATALLLAAWAHGCRRLIHGPMICSSWGRAPEEAGFREETCAFRELLHTGRWRLFPEGHPPRVLKAGSLSGLTVIPANLTLLTSLLGTPHFPDLSGVALILEDVHEPAHAIDRRLCQLQSAGVLRRLGALVFGAFSDAEDAEEIPEILREYAEAVPGGVFAGCPVGHIHPSYPIPFGRQ